MTNSELYPPLMFLAWTAVMFWVSMGWTIWTHAKNAQLKSKEARSWQVTDFAALPAEMQRPIKKQCRKRLLKPIFIWLKGVIVILLT